MYKETTINNLLIIEIDNFLSEKEVDTLLTPKVDLFNAAISHYPSYYRNNDRFVEDNMELSYSLFNKFRDFNCLKSEAIGINERLRFCRYQSNQSFSKHQDGVHYTKNQESKYTFLLYLNDNKSFTGGNTTFYNSKEDIIPQKTIIAKKGKLVVFDHKLWHKGDFVTKGNKYILRSDIMISKTKAKTHHNGYIWHLLKLDKYSFLSCGRDKNIKLWNTELTLQKSFIIHSSSVLKIIKDNDSEFLSCSRDFTIKKWNLSGQIISSIKLEEMILNIIKASNNTTLAVGTSGNIYLLNSELKIINTIKIHDNWIWDVLVLNTNNVVTCSEDGCINLTNLNTKKTKCIYKHNSPLFSINIKDKNTLHIGTKEGDLLNVSLNSGNVKTSKIHSDIIRSILYHNHLIITCGEDNKILLTDIKTNRTQELYRSNNFIQDIIVIDDIIYAAGYNGEIIKRNLPNFN